LKAHGILAFNPVYKSSQNFVIKGKGIVIKFQFLNYQEIKHLKTKIWYFKKISRKTD